jgi:HD-GYP domain-containing protein (c-di-GMP phosphodiesterase class II)
VKKLLLLQKQSETTEYIAAFLKVYSDIHIVHVEALSLALEQLNSTEFECIFIGSNLDMDGAASALNAKLKDYLFNYPACAVVGTNKGLSDQDWAQYIPKMAPPARIFDAIRFALSIPDERPPRTYVPIPLAFLHHFAKAPCHIYLKIGKEAEEIHVKRFNENDPLMADEINKYAQKQLKEVYIPSEMLFMVCEFVSTRISNQLDTGGEKLSTVEVMSEALDYASYILTSFGISPSSEKMVEQVINTLITNTTKMDNAKSRQFLEIFNGKEAFYHKHVSMTAMLASALLDEMKLDSQENYLAVTYAAFFQNFFINDEHDICCLSEQELSSVTVTERRSRIHTHAKQAAAFIRELKYAPYEGSLLIMEHHGSLNGLGFPEQKENSNMLSRLFMIANEFSLKFLQAYEKKTGEEVQSMLKDALTRYGQSNIKILEALQNCIAAYSINA